MTHPTADLFFTSLNHELGRRSSSAVLGALGPASSPLRARLREVLQAAPGDGASFLADPVFEPIFDWTPSPHTMSALAAEGLLDPDLVRAMDARPDDRSLVDYRFPAERHPFMHQEQAWRTLRGEEPHSVLVTSGTGSGKTECFLVPILDDMARARRVEGRLTGVRALFLYPLNALINSQRDRLRAWCAPFDGDVRFCLYNGETPERAGRGAARAPEQVADRKTLRDDPPPILVTNSTMLEYLLIRAEDQRIVEPSRGKLRWIVLDEAHTYLGSHAAEMALLLRRVLHSFQVDASQVRFVATSATIGSGSAEDDARLRRFLADLAGVNQGQVTVLRGHPVRPELPERFAILNASLPSLEDLAALPPEERFQTLAANQGVRAMRQRLLHSPRGATTLSELTHARWGTLADEVEAEAVPVQDRNTTGALVDLCTGAVRAGEALLRARAHLFHRTHAGLWACLSPDCPGRAGTALNDPDWPFGMLYLERRQTCGLCHSLVCDIVLCDECGSEYAAAQAVTDENGRSLIPREPQQVSDADEYLELVEGDEEDDSAAESNGFPRLLTPLGARGSTPVRIALATGRVIPDSTDGIAAMGTARFGEVFSESARTHALRCPRCGQLEQHPGELFRDTRRGGPFFLRGIIPLLLEYTPPLETGARSLPSLGRRLITFTDSRQGTARFALDAQLDAERNFTRSVVYHQLAARRVAAAREKGDTVALQAVVAALEAMPNVDENPALRKILAEQREALRAARMPVQGSLPWSAARSLLAHEEVVRTWMRDHWSHIPFAQWDADARAELMLLREFVRRPKRQNSLETLGLAAVDYPALHGDPPPPWTARSLGSTEWRNFLKTAVDFTIRGRTAVQVSDDQLRWLGVPVRRKTLQGPSSPRGVERAVYWPTVAGSRPSNRLIQLLARVLRVDAADSSIDQCLLAAWQQIYPLLTPTSGGFLLNLQEQAVLREVRDAWLCPVTRRVLDTTVCGVTPYVSDQLGATGGVCTPVRMPELPVPFWRDTEGADTPRPEVEAWVENSAEIASLRTAGVWSDLADRIVRSADYFQAAEHSAQQSGARLRQLEEGFRAGRVNLLSCSTTMEMGVDIGGLAGVAMNNPPPSPANYRQRAGRAGRRGETRAFSLTLCKNNPHGEWIFRRPMWPFETPGHVTEVSLGSERIVQRHVNSMALTRFLADAMGSGMLPRLEAGAFFEGPDSSSDAPCERFEHWLLETGPADEWLHAGLERLVHGSALQGVSPRRLLANAYDAIRTLAAKWRAELAPLQRDLAGLSDSPEDRGPRRAVELRMARMRGEYLLRELALRNFLPGYGFPTQVVPFVTTTAEDLNGQSHRNGPGIRDDNRSMSRGYPSRDLSVALRDYAPGGTVVVDGRVLEVGGLTLHWNVPVSDQARGIQAIRWAWRCSRCGDAGTSLRRPETCASEACDGRVQAVHPHPYIEPSGFAVDIRHRPTNDLTRNEYLPVEQPWITEVDVPWQALPSPSLGRYRYTPHGRIFSFSRGRNAGGYALCLRCGRAASEDGHAPEELPKPMSFHRPLRGTADAGEDGHTCRGNESTTQVQRGIWLGATKETDVFELQLRHAENGRYLSGRNAANSLAVALRQALAESLNVEEREIGWACTATHVASTGEDTWSIALFDTATGGAGFVARAPANLPRLFVRAREILRCVRNCDGACHACLLTYDTHHHAPNLDRRPALDLLSDAFLAGLQLPVEQRMFGEATVLEYEPLPAALHRELRWAQRLRLHIGGAPDSWELEAWPVDEWLRRWSADGVEVELVMRDSLLTALDVPSRGRLASWAEAGIARIYTTPGAAPGEGEPRLIAEAGNSAGWVQFGVFTEAARAPGAEWGVGVESAYIVRSGRVELGEAPPPGAALRTAVELRGNPPGNAVALTLRHELNGPIEGFGDRFWDLVLGAAPDATARLSAPEPLASIEYVDRYLTSPLTFRFLTEVVRTLRARYPLAMQDAVLSVTTLPTTRKIPGAWLDENWPASIDRESVLATMAAAFHTAASLCELSKADIAHAREMCLRWKDGCVWRLRLDEGFGFLKVHGAQIPFDTSNPLAQLAADLQNATFEVEGRIATALYVLGVSTTAAEGS